VLSRQLQASRDRFEVGEITRTDVSQSESRRARATADRSAAEGTLRSARAVYERVVGEPPVNLVPPVLRFFLPATREETVELAEARNPDVLTAIAVERASRDQIDIANSDRLPQLSIVGNAERGWEQSTLSDRSDAAAVIAQLRIPLYQGGAVSSRVREARQTAGQRRIEIDQARRQSREAAIRGWETLNAARATITALEAQVRASEIALEGVRQEALVGSRTTLDILDAEQELLDAQVGLVRARRDEAVASFQLLSAVGQMTAPALGLSVDQYDPQVNYRRVRNKLYGTDINGNGNGPEGRR
jgi:outer membrane protein/adhesin transport system outer membrane protein